MTKKIYRIGLLVTVLAIMAASFAFLAPKALASDGTFNIAVYHGINGNALGLSKELPVLAEVWKDGALLATIPLEFKDRFAADLPAGTYTIMVYSTELGAYVNSMTVGPAAIPEGVDVRAQAQLGAGKTPILSVRVK
jgi:hypothetical protein